MSCVDRIWLFLHRNDFMYMTNKFVSVAICFGLAVYTLSFKKIFYNYSAQYPEAENISSYAFIYWLLFIYYGFAGLDELIELYAVFFKRERGALGLLFEMNYFLGFGVAIYILWFVNQSMAPIADALYSPLFDFLKLQVLLFWVACAVSVFMCGCFGLINSHAKRHKQVEKDDFKQN